jgi:hypothetical protein
VDLTAFLAFSGSLIYGLSVWLAKPVIARRLPLIATLVCAAALVTQPETVPALFAQAKAMAQSGHEDLVLVFPASWCGPCTLDEPFLLTASLFDRLLEDPQFEDPQLQPIPEKALAIERIDGGERKGDPRHSDTPGGLSRSCSDPHLA